MPAGRPLRGRVPAAQEGGFPRNRISGAIRGGLRAKDERVARAERAVDRKEGGDRRQRAGRTERSGGSNPKGTRGTRVRSAARDRRSARLWDSGVSPAETGYTRTDRDHAEDGRGIRNGWGGREDCNHRRTVRRRRI